MSKIRIWNEQITLVKWALNAMTNVLIRKRSLTLTPHPPYTHTVDVKTEAMVGVVRS